MENGGPDRKEREDQDEPLDYGSREDRGARGDARRQKIYALRRAILDYGIGILIMGFGVFLLFAPKLGFSFSIDDLNRYMFSGLCVLYGGFRAWRGSKKNYFK